MERTNVWNNPEGYQRTSKKLQREYLDALIARGRPTGRVLDVGCGTGNAISFIGRYGDFDYTGVDISQDMLSFARSNNSGNLSFVESDFLDPNLEVGSQFDHVICAACLHWFHPQQKTVIRKIRRLLKLGGGLHFSTALSFGFLPGEEVVQREVIEEVRSKFEVQSQISTFDSRRLRPDQIHDVCTGFRINKISLHEELLSFSNYEDFKDWHTGSGSVVSGQFVPKHKTEAVEMYYGLLYDRYASGAYTVAYGTALVNLTKQS